MGPVVGVEEGGVEVEEGGMMVKVRIGRVEGRRGVRENHQTESGCPVLNKPIPGALGPFNNTRS